MPSSSPVLTPGPIALESARAARVTVVLPTYNEAENVGRMLEALAALPAGCSVIVVDDDSPDGTARVAEAKQAAGIPVEVIRRRGERGLGTAYLAGFRRALACGATHVVSMDCDCSHDPGALPNLLRAAEEAEVVIGSRYVPGGCIPEWPLYRRLLSAAANRFVRALFRLTARDCTSGFRVYRREVLEAVDWGRIRSTGYAFLVETLYWATRGEGVRVREVPIRFADRRLGKSKMGAREALQGATNLLRLRAELRRSGRNPPP